MANRKSSPSNVAERPVIGGKKSADQKPGALGHAWAASIVAHAVKLGEQAVAEVKSRKLRLSELMALGTAENLAARNDLTLELERIKGEAEAAKISLNAYCDANPKAASIRVECSMWLKMADAVNKGFKDTLVDLTKPWADISKAATAHLDGLTNSTGSGDGTKTNAGPRARKGGRKPTATLDKVKSFVKANIVDDKTLAVKNDVKLFQVIGLMLQPATIEQCNEVIAECVRIRDMKVKVEEEFKAKKEKESKAAQAQADKATKGKGKKTPEPAAPTPTAASKPAHPQAAADQTKFDPRTQSKLRDGTIIDVPSQHMKTKKIERRTPATA